MSQDATGAAAPDAARQEKPRNWWQWVLAYPALMIAIVSALPTYSEFFAAKQYDVPFGQSAMAREQDSMWQKNLPCVKAPFDPLVTAFNVQVDATICETGDVLIQFHAPDGKKAYRWVSVDGAFPQSAASGFISSAFASESPVTMLASSGEVICQKSLGRGRILRRISIAGQGCFDEVVNTFNGQVESSTPVACDPAC